MASITFRSDPEVDAALAALMDDGSERSLAIRSAILSAAAAKRDAALRAEAQALAEDEADRGEAQAVLQEMETLRAW